MKKRLTALKQFLFSSFSRLKNQSENVDDLQVLKNLSAKEKRICADAYRGGHDAEKTVQIYFDQWTAYCDLESEKSVKAIDEELALVKAQRIIVQVDRDSITKEERIKNASVDLKEEMDQALFDRKKSNRATERMLDRVVKEIGICTSKIFSLETYHEYLPTKKTFWDTARGLFIISLCITLLESIFTIPALQTDGFDNWLAWLSSLLLSSIIGISCHFAGESYIQKSRNKFIAWIIAGITVIAVIIYWRRHVDDNFVLSITNLLIFFVGILLSIRRHRNKYYFDLIEQKAQLESREDELTNQLELRDAEEIKIEEDFKTRAKKKAEAQINEFDAQEAELFRRKGSLSVKREKTLKIVEGEKQKGIANIKQSFERGYNDRYTRINKKWSGTTVSIILLVIGLSFGSCSHTSDSNIETMLTADRSGSLGGIKLGNADSVISYYESEIFKLDRADKGIRFYFSIVGASSYPAITKIELPPPPPYLRRNEKKRKQEIAKFREQLRTGLTKMASTQANEPYTNLARNLAFQLNYLKNSGYGAPQKSLCLWSDLLEFSWIDDFEKYKKSPALLDSNYTQIADRMNKDSPLTDLAGITVYIAYKTSPLNDELSHAAFRYWQKYLTGHGAKVEILPI
jgi:hypothetical protein